MNITQKPHNLLWILFFGSLWGFCEATLGHLLHLLPIPGLAGDLMFPLGCICMAAAWKQTGRVFSIFGTMLIAAVIKSVDLLIPGIPISGVINPITAILMEGACFWFGIRWLKVSPDRIQVGSALVLGIGWRVGYFLVSLLIAVFFQIPNLWVKSSTFLFSLLLLHGPISSLLLKFSLPFGSGWVYTHRRFLRPVPMIIAAPAMFSVALAVELFF